MKILLVNPSQSAVYGRMASPDYPPLGLAYIGAVLENAGHEVRIIDMDADRISEDKFTAITKDGYEIVGVTATTPTFKMAEELCASVKKNSNAVTVIGGIHATVAPEECASSKSVDFVVRGEGEVTVLELTDAIQGKRMSETVKGISFRKNGEVVHTPERELIKNLDEIPFPARHLFRQRRYTYTDSLLTPVMPMMTSRGCPHNCTYCCTKLIFSRHVRFRSAKNVVDEIVQLIERYGVREIHFWDDNYTLRKERVFEISNEVRSRGIRLKFAFPNGLRADQVDEKILRVLKDMGVYSMAFGVESGNQIILDNVKKGTTLKQIENAYSLAKRLGIETWGFFMIGLPGENEMTIRDTIMFARKLNPDIAKFHILKPYPGTEIYNEFKEKGLITESDYSRYGIHTRPVHRLPGLSEDDLLKYLKKAYREFYMRPSKIASQLLRLRSWNRICLNVKAALGVFRVMQ